MSRYYRIVVGAETAAPVGGTASQNAGAVWTNQVNGKCDLGAQTVEWDINVTQFATPASQAFVRIWGPSKEQISQASDFNGASIQVYAGMQSGLPLASDEANGQSGLILSGQIFQAFGNWQGINQTLDFVVTVDGGATQSQPAPLSFLWKKGQKMGDVLNQTLRIAYPQYSVDVQVSPDLVLPQDESGVYQTLQQFAAYVKGVSQSILGGNYRGVQVSLRNGVLSAYDGTQSTPTPTALKIQDLVGQPTWLGAFTVQFNTVMRADLDVGSQITFPVSAGAQAVTSAQSQSNARNKDAFSGTWTIVYIRHVGNSRAPDAQNWITTFQAVSNVASPAALSVENTGA